MVPKAGTVIRLSLVVIVVAICSLFGPRANAADYRNYMAFGDSITYGIGTSNPPGTSYYNQSNLRGYGVPGACTVICQYPQWKVQDWWPAYLSSGITKPTVAVWMIGLNDLKAGYSDDSIINGLRQVRQIGKDRGIRVVFGTITPPPRAGQGGHSDEWAVINPQRKRINDWIRANGGGPDYSAAVSCDGWLCPQYISPAWIDVHMNDAGARVMGNVLRRWIEADR